MYYRRKRCRKNTIFKCFFTRLHGYPHKEVVEIFSRELWCGDNWIVVRTYCNPTYKKSVQNAKLW